MHFSLEVHLLSKGLHLMRSWETRDVETIKLPAATNMAEKFPTWMELYYLYSISIGKWMYIYRCSMIFLAMTRPQSSHSHPAAVFRTSSFSGDELSPLIVASCPAPWPLPPSPSPLSWVKTETTTIANICVEATNWQMDLHWKMISHDGSMYGRLMLTWLGYIDGKCYHIWHTWILWVYNC